MRPIYQLCVTECRDGVEVQLPRGVCDVADAPVLG